MFKIKGMAIMLMILSMSSSVILTGRNEDLSGLSEEQKIRLIKDVIRRGPFLTSSADVRMKKFTVGHFFDRKTYEKLKGNDILGYEYDEGFHTGGTTLDLIEVKTNKKTAQYKKKFIGELRRMLGANKIRLSGRSDAAVGIALLDVEEHGTEKTLPGALVEVYFRNKHSGKHFFYRFGTGKKTGLEDAFRDIWAIVSYRFGSFR